MKEITELVQVNLETFCVDIFILKHLIWIFNVGTFKLENQCFIPQLKLSLQGMTIKNIKNELNYSVDLQKKKIPWGFKYSGLNN